MDVFKKKAQRYGNDRSVSSKMTLRLVVDSHMTTIKKPPHLRLGGFQNIIESDQKPFTSALAYRFIFGHSTLDSSSTII